MYVFHYGNLFACWQAIYIVVGGCAGVHELLSTPAFCPCGQLLRTFLGALAYLHWLVVCCVTPAHTWDLLGKYMPGRVLHMEGFAGCIHPDNVCSPVWGPVASYYGSVC